jgi:hypothetical protein
MNLDQRDKKLSQIIAKCWADESFKRKLLADPAATLKSEGVEVPPGVSIKALESNDEVLHLVIPARPAELQDEDLDEVAAGRICWACFCWAPAKAEPQERSTGHRHGVPFAPCAQ